jgi:hypothetical protein
MKSWTTKVEQDPDTGELIITFPDELMEQVGWKIGDNILWQETLVCEDTGEFTGAVLRKADES